MIYKHSLQKTQLNALNVYLIICEVIISLYVRISEFHRIFLLLFYTVTCTLIM